MDTNTHEAFTSAHAVSDRSIADAGEIVAVHPVLIASVGTTHAEAACVIAARMRGIPSPVPHRFLAIDSLPYEHVVGRIVKNGWPEDVVLDSLPRANYFRLTGPFSPTVSFDDPINRDWLELVFEPALQELARRQDHPGCGGTPAIGGLWAQGSFAEARDWFANHVQELTQVSLGNVALRPGMIAKMLAAGRGGTATGAAQILAAALKNVVPDAQIQLYLTAPCVYPGTRSDDRAFANTVAALREISHAHRDGGSVRLVRFGEVESPFDAVTLTFVSNGAVTLTESHALMRTSGLVLPYLRPATQRAIEERRVDLTDMRPFDDRGLPLQVRTEAAMTIQVVLPDAQIGLATAWCDAEVSAAEQRYEAFLGDGELTIEEQRTLDAVLEHVVRDERLELDALRSRIEGEAANVLRLRFEKARGAIPALSRAQLETEIPGFIRHLQGVFVELGETWQRQARELEKRLPPSLLGALVRSELAVKPHLLLAGADRLASATSAVAAAARKTADGARRRRAAAGEALASALVDLQNVRSSLAGILRRDEVARNAALRALDHAQAAAQARALEEVSQRLADALDSPTSQGHQAVVDTLRAARTHQQSMLRERLGRQREELRRELTAIDQRLVRRAPAFDRALVYDDASLATLTSRALDLRKHHTNVPEALLGYLRGERSLEDTRADLMALLPTYRASTLSLAQLLVEQPDQRRILVELLRGATPQGASHGYTFAPLDRSIEEQLGLRNRRDTLLIVEVPGGASGPIGQLLLREDIVPNENRLIDSGDETVRLYYLRDNLPYGVLKDVPRYEDAYRRYVGRAGAITPHTFRDAHQIPSLISPRVDLGDHTERLLYVAKSLLPDRVVPRASGGFVFRFAADTGHGFTTTEEQVFVDFASMVSWLTKRTRERLALHDEIGRLFDDRPVEVRDALLGALQRATGREHDQLRQELLRRRIDPSSFCDARQIDATTTVPTMDRTKVS